MSVPLCSLSPVVCSLAETFHGRLAELDNVGKRREVACARSDQNLWTATQWIREHRAEFKDRVYDPIRLEISVKDKKHAKVAEAAISYASMKVSRNSCHIKA